MKTLSLFMLCLLFLYTLASDHIIISKNEPPTGRIIDVLLKKKDCAISVGLQPGFKPNDKGIPNGDLAFTIRCCNGAKTNTIYFQELFQVKKKEDASGWADRLNSLELASLDWKFVGKPEVKKDEVSFKVNAKHFKDVILSVKSTIDAKDGKITLHVSAEGDKLKKGAKFNVLQIDANLAGSGLLFSSNKKAEFKRAGGSLISFFSFFEKKLKEKIIFKVEEPKCKKY